MVNLFGWRLTLAQINKVQLYTITWQAILGTKRVSWKECAAQQPQPRTRMSIWLRVAYASDVTIRFVNVKRLFAFKTFQQFWCVAKTIETTINFMLISSQTEFLYNLCISAWLDNSLSETWPFLISVTQLVRKNQFVWIFSHAILIPIYI